VGFFTAGKGGGDCGARGPRVGGPGGGPLGGTPKKPSKIKKKLSFAKKQNYLLANPGSVFVLGFQPFIFGKKQKSTGGYLIYCSEKKRKGERAK